MSSFRLISAISSFRLFYCGDFCFVIASVVKRGCFPILLARSQQYGDGGQNDAADQDQDRQQFQ